MALRGRLATLRLAQLEEQQYNKLVVTGSSPVTYIIERYRKRKVRFGIM